MTYKTGIVAEGKPGFARVKFADLDNLVTQWLPVAHLKTKEDKTIFTLDEGEHVACLMDAVMEDGCIVGAIYSEVDVPPVSSPDKFRVQFKDGGSFEYDRLSGAMAVVAIGPVTVTAPNVTLQSPQVTCAGNLTVQGNVSVDGTVMDAAGNSNHHSH